MQKTITIPALIRGGVCIGFVTWFGFLNHFTNASPQTQQRPLLKKLPPVKNCVEHIKIVSAELRMRGDFQVASIEVENQAYVGVISISIEQMVDKAKHAAVDSGMFRFVHHLFDGNGDDADVCLVLDLYRGNLEISPHTQFRTHNLDMLNAILNGRKLLKEGPLLCLRTRIGERIKETEHVPNSVKNPAKNQRRNSYPFSHWLAPRVLQST